MQVISFICDPCLFRLVPDLRVVVVVVIVVVVVLTQCGTCCCDGIEGVMSATASSDGRPTATVSQARRPSTALILGLDSSTYAHGDSYSGRIPAPSAAPRHCSVRNDRRSKLHVATDAEDDQISALTIPETLGMQSTELSGQSHVLRLTRRAMNVLGGRRRDQELRESIPHFEYAGYRIDLALRCAKASGL